MAAVNRKQRMRMREKKRDENGRKERRGKGERIVSDDGRRKLRA